jgi:phosphohistidine phosphatase
VELYFLRHATAVEPGTPGYTKDSERPLTLEGADKMKKGAHAMKKSGMEFETIVSSPYLRARQTAEIVAREYRFTDKIMLSEALTPHASFEKFLGSLKGHQEHEKILFVGHEPTMSHFIASLVSERGEARVEMKKGGLCLVEVSASGRDGALKWLLTPAVLRKLA